MRKFLLVFLVCLMPVWAAGELSNRRAPGFSLPDIQIKQHDLADYRGKVVLLEIMNTKCPHCAKFADTLEQVAKKYAGRVQVLAIANPPDTIRTVSQFMREHGISYPILFDCGQASSSYMMATPENPKVEIPHLFLIDAKGIIRNDFGYSLLTLGIFDGTDLADQVDQLLAAPAGRASQKARPKK
jgi:peroxiredoxin